MALPEPSPDTGVIVTGASAGIGAALARELAGRGHGLALVARREERLEALAAELRARHGVRVGVHPLDLADPVGRLELFDRLDREGLELVGLCNNAGVAAIGSFLENDPEDEARVVEINVVALHDLVKLAAPRLVHRGGGAILNVSSIYSAAPVPDNATYAASKAFVSSLSEALHAELEPLRVSCTVCSPGPTRTEAFAAGGAEELLDAGLSVLWQDAEEVAREAVDAMVEGRRAVTPGMTNQLAELSGRVLPRGLLLPVWRELRGGAGLRRRAAARHDEGPPGGDPSSAA